MRPLGDPKNDGKSLAPDFFRILCAPRIQASSRGD